MIHLAEITRNAHPTGSPEHTRVREYLLRQFRDLGHDHGVQTATAVPKTYNFKPVVLMQLHAVGNTDPFFPFFPET